MGSFIENQSYLMSYNDEEKVPLTHQLRFSPLLLVSTYLIISPLVEQATLCRYREMMLLEGGKKSYK